MEFDQFDLNDPKEFFNGLVAKALTDENSKFEFIRNLDMLRVTRFYKSSVKKVVKIFKDLVNGLTRDYAKQIYNDKQALEVIMSIKQFEACRDYYQKEYAVAKDMISEYKTYVFSGHILNTVLGGNRPDFECVDYRKLPIKFF
jgi:hypothetical protein